tara:strand:+ start:508 stop:771 length:264 start_codon:yes stop_codon:yes gene_type:complete
MPISKTGAFPLGYTPKTSVQANHKEQNPRFVKRKQLPKFNFFHETIKIIMEKMRWETPQVGIEPTALWLTATRSTTELLRIKFYRQI